MTNSNDALRAALGDNRAWLSDDIWLSIPAYMRKSIQKAHEKALTPSPVAGGDLREAAQALVDFIGPKDMRVYATDLAVRDLVAALNQPAAPVEAGLLDRAQLAWQRFFYPAADCFTRPIGDRLPSVDLEVADCLRLVLAAIGRNVVTPDHDVPALIAKEPSREGQIKTVAEKLAAFTGAPYEDWRHFTVEADDIIDRLSALAHPPEPAASTVAQGEAFQQRVQPWLLACFGEMIAGDREERNHRFLEEALELVQACGCTASEAHQLVDYVYGRPVGELHQEVGGVMVTLAALCLANDADMHAAGWVELDRIWGKVEAIRAKQAAKPKHSPLPQHVATHHKGSSDGQ